MKKIVCFILIMIMTFVVTSCSTNSDEGHEEHGKHSNKADNHDQHKDGNKHMKTNVDWDVSEQPIQANVEEELRVKISDPDGKAINTYEINHEKKMHVIVVSKDLSYFNHIHPKFLGDGMFSVKNRFPSGGDYKIITDFIPSGGNEVTEMEWVQVEGKKESHKTIEPDRSLTKKSKGKTVSLSFDEEYPKPDTKIKLTFSIQNEKGEPVTDLQPYLGASGHVVIISEDTEEYLHVHPLDEKATGPDAEFETTFPRAGTYKIWGQFKQNNKVFIVPYVVEVK
ncbi:hypothetical protein KUV80_15300 [Fictibacillus nanhaiensis]|uniref:hypothetical protein n=1 Tax=Fictibacillus nanhaiensis TaxID=742169 RepID=UPI001C97D288|nr:hypothetical protein [Fictibacillus nanhaiensis]MBY6038040.1 hypothetical protein [Fictibacillus nanhaiensis]